MFRNEVMVEAAGKLMLLLAFFATTAGENTSEGAHDLPEDEDTL